MPYEYNAIVTRVIDGDTIKVDVDLGFHCWLRDLSIRVHGINARELNTPGGHAARDHLSALLAGVTITITTIRPDKYGDRWLGSITHDQQPLAEQLIAQGWAAAWDGTGVKPIPAWPMPI